MMSEFKGKTVIVTGGASGMGLLSGQNFYELGANVVLCDVNAERLDEIKKEMPNVLTVVADIRFYEQVKNVVEKAYSTFGSIDVMVNCAGGNSSRIKGSGEEFCDRPIEHIDWGLDVNLKGPVYFCHEVMKYMREQKSGVIVNVGSITGEDGDPVGSDYAIAKSGVMYGLTRSMALLGAKYGVRCVCVSPGPVLTRPSMANLKTLLGRAAEPQELVDMILYLASYKAKFITGTNYMVDGGRTLLR